MISVNRLRKLLESGQPVNLRFWDKSGEIVDANQVVATSSYYKNNTINVKHIVSGEIRKIRIWSIFACNGEEVSL